MKRVLLGTLAGGFVFFVWGAVSWMVLPWHDATLKDLPNEETILRVLRQNVGEAGVFWFPAMGGADQDEAARKAYEARHRAGPVGWLVYRPQGAEPMAKSTFFKAAVLDCAAALIAALVLAASRGRGYAARAALVAALGLFAGLVTHASQWTWMALPGAYALTMMADLVIGWLLAGLAMAAIVKGRAA